jgi:hypothetical protein
MARRVKVEGSGNIERNNGQPFFHDLQKSQVLSSWILGDTACVLFAISEMQELQGEPTKSQSLGQQDQEGLLGLRTPCITHGLKISRPGDPSLTPRKQVPKGCATACHTLGGVSCPEEAHVLIKSRKRKRTAQNRKKSIWDHTGSASEATRLQAFPPCPWFHPSWVVTTPLLQCSLYFNIKLFLHRAPHERSAQAPTDTVSTDSTQGKAGLCLFTPCTSPCQARTSVSNEQGCACETRRYNSSVWEHTNTTTFESKR